MNISLLIARSIAFTVISSVFPMIGQEGAIAASEAEINSLIQEFSRTVDNTYARSYRDGRKADEKKAASAFQAAWAKSNPAIAPFLGNWSAIEEMKRIYPSQINGKVCIIDTFLSRSGVGYEFSTGEIKNNRIYASDNTVLFLTKSNQGKILGTIFTRKDNGQLGSYGYAHPRPLISPSQASSNASYSDNISPLSPQFESSGCLASLPSSSKSQVTNSEIANLPDGIYFYGQAPEVNQIGKMYYLFQKRNDQVTGVVYTPRSEATCFTGEIQNDQVKRVTVAFASYDRSGKNANWSSNPSRDYDLSKAYRLNPNQYGGNVSAEISDCQSGIAQVLGSSQSENGSDIYPSASAIKAILEDSREKRNKCFSYDPRGRGCPPSIDDIPKTDQTIKNAWAKVDPQVARFLGSWYVGMEFLPYIYPSTVKGQVCVITHGDATVFGVGRVTGKSLRYQDKVAYSMDGYANRSSQPPYELNFFGNPGLLAFHSTNRSDSLSVAISKSSEIKPLDEWGNRFKTLFEEAGCTTGLPEGTIATKPIEQLQPIAPGGSYAYPSPAEFDQFKKDLKASPVALSTADRKAREDFQAEWQKKNRAIAPYIGAWKTADNQDVYVFPSKVAGRVCVLRSKDGALSPDLGVSMTTDMRYDGNNGMFKVDLPDVVAGRSDKTQPLSAFYGAIGSPDVSSVKGELEQAQCISELPKGAKKDNNNSLFTKVEKNPTTHSSLGGRSIGYYKTLDYSNPNHLFGKSEFQEPISPPCVDDICYTDIRQGTLGDCYLMASLAAIAYQKPSTIREIISDYGNGQYLVTLYPNFESSLFQQPVKILVDASLPLARYPYSSIYAGYSLTSEDGEASKVVNDVSIGLWVALIEKAYAITIGKGSYDNGHFIAVQDIKAIQTKGIEWDTSSNALSRLTGKDVSSSAKSLLGATGRLLRDKQPHWIGIPKISQMKQWMDQKRAIVVESTNHAYAVVSVDENKNTISLYNPWGQEKIERASPSPYLASRYKNGVIELDYSEFVNDFLYVSIAAI